MPIDTSIYSNLKPVQFDIQTPINLLNQGRQMQMQQQSLRMQQESHAQQMQAGGIELQEKQLQLQDEQKMREAWQQANGDPDQMFSIAGKMGVGPKTMLQTQQSLTQMREAKAKLTAAELENANLKNDQLHALLDPVAQETDPQKQAALWDQQQQLGLQRGLLTIADVRQHPYPGSPDQVQSYVSSLNTDKWVTSAAAKSRADSAAATAKTGQDRLAMEKTGIDLKNREAQRSQDANDLAAAAKQGGQALGFALRKLSEASPDRYKQFDSITWKSTPEDILKLGLTPDQQVTTSETAKRDAQTALNEAATRANAAGHLGLAQKEFELKKQTFDQTFGPNANPALVGVEPHLRVPAAAGAQKITDEYNKAMDASANMQSFLDAARAGNKMAGSNLPIMGAESLQALNGIKRINRTEIEAYQGAGSLLDKIQGKIGKLVSGQPIPADVMKDIESLQTTLAGNATSSANAKMDAHNGIYRSNFKLAPRGQGGGAGAVPEVTNQADYDKLPKGAKYTNNGVPHVKQ